MARKGNAVGHSGNKTLAPLPAGWRQTRQYMLAVGSASNCAHVAVPLLQATGISSYKSLSGLNPTAGSAAIKSRSPTSSRYTQNTTQLCCLWRTRALLSFSNHNTNFLNIRWLSRPATNTWTGLQTLQCSVPTIAQVPAWSIQAPQTSSSSKPNCFT